jgi:predicted pyridoxine 5'-phosphate oxidase superfamily flavin-nucleotide-binding protein
MSDGFKKLSIVRSHFYPIYKSIQGETKMTAIPEEVSKAWENREGPIVLTTINSEGIPNAIYATCVSKYSDDTLVVADNFFHKTRANILAGSKASLLFITKEGKSYQIKGTVVYYTEGPIYEDMKKWNPEKLPGHAAAALKVQHVFCGAEELA